MTLQELVGHQFWPEVASSWSPWSFVQTSLHLHGPMPFPSIHVLLVAWSRWNCYSAEHVTITLRFTCLHTLNINIQVVNVGAASICMAIYHNHDINDFMKVSSPFPQVIRVKACMKERECTSSLTSCYIKRTNTHFHDTEVTIFIYEESTTCTHSDDDSEICFVLASVQSFTHLKAETNTCVIFKESTYLHP